MRYIAFLAALVAALTLSPPAAAATDWAWPVRGDVVTPYKNGDDPYASGQHRGIDIAAPVGTRVDAAVGGRVTYAGVAGSSGLTVAVRSADGRYDVSYLHLSAVTVAAGDAVERGDRLGAVGTSGRRSAERPHLHFGVREAGDRHAYHDPLDFLPPLAPPVTDAPPPVPVPSPDPVPAPPAGAAALARVPEPVAVAGPGPLPVGAAVAGLASPEGSVTPSPHVGAGAASAPSQGTAASPAGTGSARARGARPSPGRAAAPARDARPSPRPASAPAHGARPSPFGSAPPRAAVASARDGVRVTRADVSHAPADRSSKWGRGSQGKAELPPEAGPAGPAGAHRGDAPRLAAPDRRTVKPPSGDSSLNLGWLAAVIGLTTAAICLGHPQSAQRAARSGRTAVGALLRPLAGRG